jgi:2-dehydro-3-deoxyphosphogluconate aldolase/(4S)-4-hydroxy-2-oxoglutarate aldolase
MEKSMKKKIISAIEEHKIIAIIRGVPREKLVDLAKALYRGGIRLLEITYSANGSVSDTDTAESIAELVNAMGDRMYIGAGTVLTVEQVSLTAKAGGSFIISPNVDEDVISATVKLGLVSMPGALTPTEICQAHKYGADFVKLFPAGTQGTAYFKAVTAPLNHIRLLAVGGVNEKNIADFMAAGAVGAGVGGNLVNKTWIANGEFDKITALAKEFTEKAGV